MAITLRRPELDQTLEQAYALYKIIRNKSQNLRWAATLRSLKPRPKTPAAVEPSNDYLNTGKVGAP